MSKRKWTEEERKAFGERMKAARATRENLRVDNGETIPPRPSLVSFTPAPEEEVQILDLTRENLVNESSVTELVRRMFDEGNYPDVIKVTSHQMIETFDSSPRTTWKLDGIIYRSPFGEHWVEVVSRKELDREDS